MTFAVLYQYGICPAHPLLPGQALALVLELNLVPTFIVTLAGCVISNFYVAVIKYPDQDNLLKKEFIQAHKSEGVRAIMKGSMGKNGSHASQSRKPSVHILNHKPK